MRLAVTGAGGYLGGTVVDVAAQEPDLDVRAIVRRPAPWLPTATLAVPSLVGHASEAVAGCETVIHLAGPNEDLTRRDPDGAVCTTIASSRAVAEACAEHHVRRLVYVSTVHVYGAALVAGATVDEATTPHPRNDYAIARLASEHTILGHCGSVELVILRLTNGVGPPPDPSVQRWSLVANDLCRQAAQGGPLRLQTPGRQWRDFVSLSDAARIVVAATRGHALAPGVYNLGSGRPLTVRGLAELVAARAARAGLGQLPVEAPAAQQGVASEAPPIVSCAKLAKLGLAATTPLEEAIDDTLSFCVSHPTLGQGQPPSTHLSLRAVADSAPE